MARQSRAPTVLLTRPAAQSARFAAALGGEWDVLIAPLMALRLLELAAPLPPARAVILTSQVGVEAAGGLRGRGVSLPDLAYCVGARTAAVAQEAGFRVQSADGDAAALVALIRAAGEMGPLLHLRGRDSRGDVAGQLSAAGIPCAEVIVYAQEAVPLSSEAIALLRSEAPVIVPLFSPRSARLFVEAAKMAGATASLWIAALSPAVAGAAALAHPARMIVAPRPDADALITAMQHYRDVAGP